MMMAASLSIATLFPEAAILVRRVAEPLTCEAMDVNVSDYTKAFPHVSGRKKRIDVQNVTMVRWKGNGNWKGGEERAYSVVDDVLGAGIVVDVDGDAAEGCYFGRELFQAGVVLAFALVCFGHCCGFIALMMFSCRGFV